MRRLNVHKRAICLWATAALFVIGYILNVLPFGFLSRSSNAVDLLIVIPSAPAERELRDLLRHTWLRLGHDNADGLKTTKHYFLIGTKNLNEGLADYVNTESSEHQDLIIMDDLIDSYFNISRKMLKAYQYLIENEGSSLPRFRFLLKTDSDSFVNVPALLQRLDEEDVQGEDWIHLGFFIGTGPVFRKGKWSEFSWNSCQHYTPYAAGGGFILSYKAVEYIAQNANNLRVFVNEDVNVGFWLAPLQVKRIHDRRFNTEFKTRGCYNSYLIAHPYKPEDIRTMYERYIRSDGKRICDQEFTVRKSYEYNWNTEPAKCCARTLDEL